MLPIKQRAKPASQDTSGYSFTQFGSSSHSLRFDEFCDTLTVETFFNVK